MTEARGAVQGISIACLGPSGTFSEEAASRHFGQDTRPLFCTTIDDVFDVVEARAAPFGVVPVENSLEGAIGHTLDRLVASPLRISGEVALPIRQHLLRREAQLDGITRVYGHAQSLAQCQRFVKKTLPLAERIAVSSNAEAARLAALELNSAALAGKRAAAIHALTILAEGVEDDPTNTTRFLVIGEASAAPSGHDKTSLVMSAPNRPGAMVALLRPFSRHGVSMTKLESRPSRRGLWDYLFFVDVEGHAEDAALRRALVELQARAGYLQVLGSYPMARS
ncbi:prephenate dehydratase [Polyangium sp. y55x31]|uniref:prephenate dehydratase n=1 Tax=Polyangium sp. y55x31 TaxID=3042688 RepID=UPI002482FC71|nr:prephenate dehydratase [Polyangium sp. y55x31]MDI1483800.1 prephenate dehydratase [Polyangium sp. y55x31]